MLDITVLGLLSIIIIAAYMIKGISGFGEGLIMIPMMLLFLDMKLVLPLVLIFGLLANIYHFFFYYKDVDIDIIKKIILPSLIGVVIGTSILVWAQSEILKRIFGVFIAAYAVMRLIKKINFKNHVANWKNASIAGGLAGFLEALFGTAGPPMVIYLQYIKTKKKAFRATCVAAFIIFSSMRVVSYGMTGILDSSVISTSLVLLVPMVVGSFFGMRLHNKFTEGRFQGFVSILLLGVGILLAL